MATYPSWITPAGSLGSFYQGQAITNVNLGADNTTGFELLTNTLPPGLKLNASSGVISGIPKDPGVTKSYEFCIRAYNRAGEGGTKLVDDRNFTLTIESNNTPTLLTPEGYLTLGNGGEQYVINKSAIYFQFQATAAGFAPGQKLRFNLEENKGTLPPGLSLTEDGILYGIIEDVVDLDYKIVKGNYDEDFYDINPFDYGGGNSPASAESKINALGQLSEINLTDGGVGYILEPSVIIGGSVETITVNDPGFGYGIAPEIIIQNSPTPGGVNAKARAVLEPVYANDGVTIIDRFIKSITITEKGTGYTYPPEVIIKSNDTGQGAIATASLSPGYDAKATANISGGSVVSIDIKNKGSGYTNAPKISFGQPQVGPKVLGKTYRFTVSVSNGDLTDTKTYAIIVNSENTLRVDTTFIQSDTVIYRADNTFYQAPIWITPEILPTVRANNNVTFLLKTFDITPGTGTIEYTLLPTNLDLTTSQLGPVDTSSTLSAPFNTYLQLDTATGEIYGTIPYQPQVSREFNFTIKAARMVNGIEEIANLRQFTFTLKGNADNIIEFTSPDIIGSIKPNEVSLLNLEATSSLSGNDLTYQIIPGYGRNSTQLVIDKTISELYGQVLIPDEGINPIMIFERGQTYKIKIKLGNFTASIRTLDNNLYSIGLSHTDGTTGASAQEKSTGTWIFQVPFNAPENLMVYLTNQYKDGLNLYFEQYNALKSEWNKVNITNFFSLDEANIKYASQITSGAEPIIALLNKNSIEFTLYKYSQGTTTWQVHAPVTSRPLLPSNNDVIMDLVKTSIGVFNFSFDNGGSWAPIASTTFVNAVPNNSTGVNGDHKFYYNAGEFKVYRKVSGQWKVIQNLPISEKTLDDPRLFVNAYNKVPATNILNDVWWKYNNLYDGDDAMSQIYFKQSGNLPSGLSLALDGNIVGKVTPSNIFVYRSNYNAGILYNVDDVVLFDGFLYKCVTQYESSGNWYNELANWVAYRFESRSITSIDQKAYGVNATKFNSSETTIDEQVRFRARAYDNQNISFLDKDFRIQYEAISDLTLTNIMLQPFLDKDNRSKYYNFITNPSIFEDELIYRPNDPQFGVQRIPKMLLLPGIQSTTAERYAGAIFRNFYDRSLYFGSVKTAKAKVGSSEEYEIVYIEINDPYEINGVSVASSIKLPFVYDELSTDYNKVRVDDVTIDTTETGLDTIFPSSITNMQAELKLVSLVKTENLLSPAELEDWGSIVIVLDQVTGTDDWGAVAERISYREDFMRVLNTLQQDDRFRPLWMNTSQDNSGVPIGFVKAVPICYVKPGQGAKIVKNILNSGFDFKTIPFTIDRLIIENVTDSSGAKYIKFANRDII